MSTGKLIVIEGLDGCGKTTQCELLGTYLRNKGRPKVKRTLLKEWKSNKILEVSNVYIDHMLHNAKQQLITKCNSDIKIIKGLIFRLERRTKDWKQKLSVVSKIFNNLSLFDITEPVFNNDSITPLSNDVNDVSEEHCKHMLLKTIDIYLKTIETLKGDKNE